MSSIGFRCWADRFAYVVLVGTVSSPTLVDHGICAAPTGHSRQQILQWLRKEAFEILDRHKPEKGFFKCTEPIAKTKILHRGEFEGVLQEAGLSHACRLSIESCQKNQIKKATGFSGAAKDLSPLLSPSAISSLNKDNYREAALVALCGL